MFAGPLRSRRDCNQRRWRCKGSIEKTRNTRASVDRNSRRLDAVTQLPRSDAARQLRHVLQMKDLRIEVIAAPAVLFCVEDAAEFTSVAVPDPAFDAGQEWQKCSLEQALCVDSNVVFDCPHFLNETPKVANRRRPESGFQQSLGPGLARAAVQVV